MKDNNKHMVVTSLEEAMPLCDRAAIMDQEPYVVIKAGVFYVVKAECEAGTVEVEYRYPEGKRQLVGV